MQLPNKDFTNFINTVMDEANSNAKKHAVKDIFMRHSKLGKSTKDFGSEIDYEGFKLAAKDLVEIGRFEVLNDIKDFAKKMDAENTWRKYQEDGEVEVFESMPDYFETGVFAGNDRIIRRCDRLFNVPSGYTINL